MDKWQVFRLNRLSNDKFHNYYSFINIHLSSVINLDTELQEIKIDPWKKNLVIPLRDSFQHYITIATSGEYLLIFC